MDKERVLKLLHRLRFEPSYGLHSDERRLRLDAADALEELMRKLKEREHVGEGCAGGERPRS